MRLNRGCGCLALILLILDIVLLAGAMISLIRGPSAEPMASSRLGSAFSLIITFGNVAVCVTLILAAFRGRALGTSPSEPADTEEVEGDEGERQREEEGEQEE